MIDMVCPHCKLGLKFPDQLAGQQSACDKCGGEMYVLMPNHLKQKDQESQTYQFNVSMEEMQNPMLGHGNEGISNLMDIGDLDIMSATSGMSARSMGVTSYSRNYEQVKGGDTKTTILWILGFIFLFPICLPMYLHMEKGMAKGKAIGLGIIVGILFCFLTSLALLSAKNKAGSTGALELNPPVNIQSDGGSGN